MAESVPAPEFPVLGLREAAELLNMRPPNVRKFLEGHGLYPQELAAGPVWSKLAIEGLASRRSAGK